MKIALIQMNSQPDRAHNLAQAEKLMTDAMAGRPDLIVLPEHFDWMGGTPEDKSRAADLVPGGQAYTMLQDFARRNQVWVHGGSIMERDRRQDTVHNTTIVFNTLGEQIGRYRKIHLFDIVAPNGTVYAESAVVTAGQDQMIYELNGWRIACVICYDLRFSRLFDSLAEDKVDIFILPAAFTRQTGEAHWEVLCRARAIEYQAYLVACGQCGTYPTPAGLQRETFGQSLVVDPWGTVVARAGSEPCLLTAELDADRIMEVRRLVPMSEHRMALPRMAVHHRGARR